ncbi:hypothetical protein YC2023_056919 [Brassica napus]
MSIIRVMALSYPPPLAVPSSYPFHFLPSSSDPPYDILRTHPSLSLLSNCRTHQSLRETHAQMVKTGLHNTNYALSKLLELCVVSPHFDGLPYAVSVFETIQEPNLLIWNTMLRGLASSSDLVSPLEMYVRMVSLGHVPNAYTFPFLLKSCAKSKTFEEGRQIHAQVMKLGCELDRYAHTSLISMYARNGRLEDARKVFDTSSQRDVVSCTALITGYASRGDVRSARKVFDGITERDVVSWNAMITGYVENCGYEEALELFKEMMRTNVRPDEGTLVSVLSACAQSGSIELGREIHTLVDDHHGFGSSLKIVNAFIGLYSKCGDVEIASGLFEGLSCKDVVSWNTLIGGYTHMNLYKEALLLFQEMLRSGESPNDVTMLSVLPACAHLGAIDIGRWIHVYIDKRLKGVTNGSALRTSLIDMYAKCGDIEAAHQVFNSMMHKSLSSWNAMIFGFAMHGRANAAFDLFSRMRKNGIEPDDITLVGLLSACSHSGLLDLGRHIFKSVTQDYNITPKLEHYGCMIDLLGHAGLFKEAEEIIHMMPMEPDGVIWCSLLKACKMHGNLELAESFAQKLMEIEPENSGSYVLLSNIYATAGRWEDVARIREVLNGKGMKKVPGCSSIEIDSVVHEFIIGDKLHPQSREIYRMLEEMDVLLEEAGFVPDTSEVLQEMEEEWKEGALRHHSEKLAIAFGLISTKPGTKLTVVKNLRVCRNCHEATKLISKIYNREIVARDRTRFHHFRDGNDMLDGISIVPSSDLPQTTYTMKRPSIVCIVFLIVISITTVSSSPDHGEVEDETEFSYEKGGEKGPEKWGTLKPEWKMCGNGTMQSPIDLTDKRVFIDHNLGPLRGHYLPSNATIKNRGHDIMLEFEGGNAGIGITINGTVYQLQQLHWHSPSEHTINGKRFVLEEHMVHQSKDGRFAVVAFLYSLGRPDSFLLSLERQLKRITDAHESEDFVSLIDPRAVNFKTKFYYRYLGSLTTPPCSENVTWSISREQSNTNARPLQRQNGRPRYHLKVEYVVLLLLHNNLVSDKFLDSSE